MAPPKGVSNNPSGRPKRAKIVTQALLYVWNQPHSGKKIGLPRKPTCGQVAARAMLQKAIDGDVAAFNLIADRVEGKVAMPLIGGDFDEPPIQTEDMSLKEVARRIGFILLSGAQAPEDGDKTQKK